MISFGNNFTVLGQRWTQFKATATSKNLILQCDEEPDSYTVFGVDGYLAYQCTIWRGRLPDGVVAGGYTQQQNDSDKADFEANFKAGCNKTVDRKSSDGRSVIRSTIASGDASRYQLRCISFYTANPGSLKNIRGSDWQNYGDVVCKCYNAAGAEVTGADLSTAVKTFIDFEPQFGYEIIGGAVDIPTELKDGTTDAWWAWCVALPDIPPQYGGQFEYVQPANLEAVMTFELDSDGRATSFMPYTPEMHTNKLRFCFKHPAGVQKRFQLYLEIFH